MVSVLAFLCDVEGTGVSYSVDSEHDSLSVSLQKQPPLGRRRVIRRKCSSLLFGNNGKLSKKNCVASNHSPSPRDPQLWS